MAYYLDLFTPETWEAFQQHGADVTGFRQRHWAVSQRIGPGDIFLCYLTRLSRWCGVLESIGTAYQDQTPIFTDPDPFVVRFKVHTLVALSPERSVPVFEDEIWNGLAETRNIRKGSVGWAKYYRGSLRRMSDEDGRFLVSILTSQKDDPKPYPLSDRDKRRLRPKLVARTLDRIVEVEVPDDEEEIEELVETEQPVEARLSIQMQAKVAQVGAEMGFRIWIPKGDRGRVLELVPLELHDQFIQSLPINYDDTTLRTVEQIDVIWLKGRSMARAFEIEHTTAIYSGLLRMADLLALQPNMDIHLHIVAPDEKRERVLREIKRPVFSLLDQGPLYEKCSYVSYESINELGEMKHLSHMSDSILEEYEERAED